MGTSATKLDVEQPLLNLGLDSLTAVEVANRIHAMVDVDVSVMKLMEGLSVAGLAAFVLERLTETSAPASASRPASVQTAEQVPNA